MANHSQPEDHRIKKISSNRMPESKAAQNLIRVLAVVTSLL